MLLQNQSNTGNFNKLIYIKFSTAKPKPSPNGLGFLVWYGYLEGGFEPIAVQPSGGLVCCWILCYNKRKRYDANACKW